MPISTASKFDLKKFWSIVMTVDADMEEEEEEEVAAPWSEKERRHIAQSFKQRSLATLPLRFSSKTAVAAMHRCRAARAAA